MHSFRLDTETTGARIAKLAEQRGISQAEVIDQATLLFDAETSPPWQMSETRRAKMLESLETLETLILKNGVTYSEIQSALDGLVFQFETSRNK